MRQGSILLRPQRNRIAGALWLVEEGGLEPSLSQAVWAGYRRPRGNLVAQSLAARRQPASGHADRAAYQPYCRASGSPAQGRAAAGGQAASGVRSGIICR